MALTKKGLYPVLVLAAVALLLQACETRPPKRPAEHPASTETAAKAEKAGEYMRAANEYERLAESATPPQKQDYLIRAVGLYLKAAQIHEAKRKIQTIQVTGLDKSFIARRKVLEARIAAFESNYAQAIKLLNAAKKVSNLDPVVIAEIHWVRAQARAALNKPYRAARDLITRERYLVNKKIIEDNQLQLWKTLNVLSRVQLDRERKRTRDPVAAGWLELVLLSLDYEGRTRPLKRAINQWKKANPAHPITTGLLAIITSPKPGFIGHIRQIALLLPLSSSYGRAATAVRDGFLAMDAANPDADKPEIRVYDIGEDPAQTPDFYEQAVRGGADLIVGPLGLKAVDAVAQQTDLAVPTLLLSHTEEKIDVSNIFQFGLPPEQEARQAAERAYLDGHRQAGVLYPDTAWGKRMEAAFIAHWQQLGGLLIQSQSYDPTAGDHSEPIRNILNITQSQARKAALAAIVKLKLEFRPRPRTDIDFIFLAADAKHGRLIKPQLNYHEAARIPVYATSRIFTGKADPAKDSDLNGVIFGDMPWILLGDNQIQDLRSRLQQGWPQTYTAYDRLFALGVDSYAIVPHLNRINTQEAVRFHGVTSGLSVTRSGRIHRQLIWARFRRGVPRILDTFFKYQNQLNISHGKKTGNPSRPRQKS